jgi:REP element-mobilizing transposase RayT
MGRRRAREKHIQLELLTKDGTRRRSNRGGKRKGAGRKPKSGRSGTSHVARPKIKASVPMHVTIRLERDIGTLRRPLMYKALLQATIVAAKHADMRIIHMSIQKDHLHLILEADNHEALTRGMKSFLGSAAKRINACIVVDGKRRRGRVFERFHLELITNPHQAQRTLSYVLNNWRKHQECFDREAQHWMIDPYSSANLFDGWLEREQIKPWSGYVSLRVQPPTSWLLYEGWKKYGPISCFDIPSSQKPQTRIEHRKPPRS